MTLFIRAIGTAVPDHSIAQEDAAEAAARLSGLTDRQRRLVPTLYRHSGVRKRHSVVLDCGSNGRPAQQSFYHAVDASNPHGPTTAERMDVYARSAAPLASQACRRALDAAGFRPDDITDLVTVSCSGFSAPGVDVQVIRDLGLRPQTARTHVGFMGCHGALNGLRVAGALTGADRNARVLVCAVELCTLHHQYGWNPEQIVANALFADGAAAAVCTGEPDSSVGSPLLHARSASSFIVPDTEDLMSWRIGDHGFEMGLSPRVPDVIRSTLRAWVQEWLSREGLTLDQVGEWAIHPGGPRILQACLEALELSSDDIVTSKSVLADFGNMSSPTILFILDRLSRRAAPGPWGLLAFGPGLTIEAALIEPQPLAAADTVGVHGRVGRNETAALDGLVTSAPRT
jgi:predicted naringenin-chalcone synthase